MSRFGIWRSGLIPAAFVVFTHRSSGRTRLEVMAEDGDDFPNRRSPSRCLVEGRKYPVQQMGPIFSGGNQTSSANIYIYGNSYVIFSFFFFFFGFPSSNTLFGLENFNDP